MANFSQQFAGKVAIITGGSLGIGLSLARALAHSGARVFIASRSADKLAVAVDTLRGESLAVEPRVLDVRDRAAFRQLAAEIIAAHGGIDLLFNNAGVSVFGEARDHTDEDWDDVIDTDLRGVINGVCAVYPHMINRRSGHIVNVASIAGLMPTPGGVAYTAAKSGVVGLSEALRFEAALHGVRVSAVCPAAIQTSMTQTSQCRGLNREKFLASLPGHVDSPDRCATAILRGVARNKSIILPGVAGLFARLHRYLPWVTRLLMAWFARVVARNRADHT